MKMNYRHGKGCIGESKRSTSTVVAKRASIFITNCRNNDEKKVPQVP